MIKVNQDQNKVLAIAGNMAGGAAIIAGISAIALSIMKQGVYPDWVNIIFFIIGIMNIFLGFALAAIVRK